MSSYDRLPSGVWSDCVFLCVFLLLHSSNMALSDADVQKQVIIEHNHHAHLQGKRNYRKVMLTIYGVIDAMSLHTSNFYVILSISI